MKKLSLFVLGLTLLSFSARAETEKVTVNGMVCAFCAAGIKKSFSKLPDVDQTIVDLDQMLVTIVTKDGKKLDDMVIRKVIKDNGFDTVKIERAAS